MNKKDWIDLINAIRLRKDGFRLENDDFVCSIEYREDDINRGYLKTSQEKTNIRLLYKQCSFVITHKPNKNNFCLSYYYGYDTFSNALESTSLDKVEKYSPSELFIPHARAGGFNHKEGFIKSYEQLQPELVYSLGFYVAAFFHALNIKNPLLKVVNNEWMVIDEALEYFDFITYFKYSRTFPIQLPLPPVIIKDKDESLKLPEDEDREE